MRDNLGEIKFPKYTREQNLVCKLTDNDIASIRSGYSKGLYSSYQLADMYNVSQSTIWYWVSESYRKKQLTKLKLKPSRSEALRAATKWLKRKRIIQPDILKYRSIQGRIHRNKVRNDPIAKIKNIIYSRRWWKAHREEKKLYDKNYYDAHREQILVKKRLYRQITKGDIIEKRETLG